MSTSTFTSTIALQLTSTVKESIPEIQYSNTASRSTEYDYSNPNVMHALHTCMHIINSSRPE